MPSLGSFFDVVPHAAGLLCDLLWSDPDKDITGWSENDRGVSFTFGPDVVSRFLQKHDMDLICRAHQVPVTSFIGSAASKCPSKVVEDGYEFFAKRHLVTLFSAPNYCGEFDNAGAMMSVDETLLCSFQVRCHVLLLSSMYVTPAPLDFETSRKESQVSVWWDEHGAAGDATSQTEEEGRQDGLRQVGTGIRSS